jgi:hypothetical protein
LFPRLAQLWWLSAEAVMRSAGALLVRVQVGVTALPALALAKSRGTKVLLVPAAAA